MEPIPVDQDSDEDPMMADDHDPGSYQTRPTRPNIQDSPFRDFIENDLMKPLEPHSPESWYVNWVFFQGMGSAAVDTRLVAVHEAIDSGLTRRARVETVGNFLKAVAEKCGGNANLTNAWYGGTRDDICKILRYGFSVSNLDEHGTVRLAPVNVSLEAAKLSHVDEYGFRHLLLCKVIMGKTDTMRSGANHVGACCSDSCVDDVGNLRRFYVWSEFMNLHILPNVVVSFKAPECLDGCYVYVVGPSRAANPAVVLPGTSGGGGGGSAQSDSRLEMDLIMLNLTRLIPPQEMAIVLRLLVDFNAARISEDLFIRLVTSLVTDDNLDMALRMASSDFGSAVQGRGDINGESSSAAQDRAGGSTSGGYLVRNALVEGFLSMLVRFITPEQVAKIRQCLDDLRANKITLTELYQRVIVAVNNDALIILVWNDYKSSLGVNPGKPQV